MNGPILYGAGTPADWAEKPLLVTRALDLIASRLAVLEAGGHPGSTLTIGDGENATTIKAADELAGDAQDFSIIGSRGSANSDGGKLIFRPGSPQGIGAPGTVELQTEQGTARLTVMGVGTVNINGTLINTSGGITGCPNVGLDDGGYIGNDAQTRLIFNDNVSALFEIDDVDTLLVTATALDGKDVLRLINMAGRRSVYTYGWPSTNTAVNRNLYTTGTSTHGGNDGYIMPRDGSIVSITIHCDINAIVSANIDGRVNKGGTFPGANCVIVAPGVGNNQSATATFAAGTYTFVAGDLLGATRVIDGTSATTDDVNIVIEVEWND